MTTTEMEMRVAKVLYAVENRDSTGGWDTESATPELRKYWVKNARAAIRAMRMPTTEMLREAGMVVAGNTETHSAVWETMIDAASPGDAK